MIVLKGHFISFKEDVIEFSVTKGKKYKIENVEFININERDYYFKNDKGVLDYVSTSSSLFHLFEFSE